MSQPITSTSASGSEIHQTSPIGTDQQPEAVDIAKAGQQVDKSREQQTGNASEFNSEFNNGSVKDKKARLAALVHRQTLVI